MSEKCPYPLGSIDIVEDYYPEPELYNNEDKIITLGQCRVHLPKETEITSIKTGLFRRKIRWRHPLTGEGYIKVGFFGQLLELEPGGLIIKE